MQQPQMRPGTVEMVSVEWILKNVHESVEFWFNLSVVEGWMDMMCEKARDDSFHALVYAILERGFRVPICLSKPPGCSWALGNGHHRLTAAILLCLDEIPVFWSRDDDYMKTHVTTDAEEDSFLQTYTSSADVWDDYMAEIKFFVPTF